jgi:hypothetical protein
VATALSQLAASAAARAVPWHASQRDAWAALSGKQLLQKLSSLQSQLVNVPLEWSPYIKATSSSSVEVLPASAFATSPASAAEEAVVRSGRERPMGVQEDGETVGDRDAWTGSAPDYAAVALALGASKGTGLAVGVLVSSVDEGRVGEGCLLGLELTGLADNFGLVVTVTFAPMSGRMFMHYPAGGPIMVAQVMPAAETTDPDRRPECVEAWMSVEECGNVAFCRRIQPAGTVEMSGKLPFQTFPNWVEQFHASLHLQCHRLETPAKTCVTWASSHLPQDVHARTMLQSDFKALWYVYEDEMQDEMYDWQNWQDWQE